MISISKFKLICFHFIEKEYKILFYQEMNEAQLIRDYKLDSNDFVYLVFNNNNKKTIPGIRILK